MIRPRSHPDFPAGFTLIELLIVVLLVSILSVYAAVSTPTTAEATLSEQAHLLARSLRHTQTLAMTWGRPLQLAPGGGSYSVSCVTAGTAPCDVTPVNDPATGQPFVVTLSNGAAVAGATFQFDTLGRPNAGGVLTLSASGATNRTVTVTALTGFVSVSP